jgi:predicted transcriptional regulator YdeE
MEPRIIKVKELLIAGLPGDGADTGAVWAEFDARYNVNPFARADNNGYEVRFPDRGDIFAGFSVASADAAKGYETLILPAAKYAVFDVLAANGYDSENMTMQAWLDRNADRYEQLSLKGQKYVAECYNERFKGGGEPDSVVEIWIPLKARMGNN